MLTETLQMAGGITINATTKLTRIDDKMIRAILQSYKSEECSYSTSRVRVSLDWH